MSAAGRPAPWRLTRALWLARAVMLWERSAGLWTPFLLAALAVAALGLWGALDALDPAVRVGVVAALLALAAAMAVRNLAGARLPGRDEARRRVETDSRLEHAPFAALDDAPAAGDPALWALHQDQAAQDSRRARVGRPKAGIAAADPYAFRYALLLALAVGVWLHGRPGAERALAALTLDPAAAAASVRDGWQALAEGGNAGPMRDPDARALAEAAAAVRSEWRPYAVLGKGEQPSWYGPVDHLHRAPASVQVAVGTLATLDGGRLDPASRAALAWAGRRLQAADDLREAKRIAAELDAVARHIERGGGTPVRAAGTQNLNATRG